MPYRPVIVVNDIAASSGGALTVLKDFYKAVNNHTDNARWIFLLSHKYIEDTEKVKIVVLPRVKKRLNRLIFDHFTGWKLINKYNPSVVFSLQNTVVHHCMGRMVTYIHQPLPFQKEKNYSLFKKKEFGMAAIQHLLGAEIKKSIKLSDLNIVQTKWMKNAVESSCGVNNVKQIYPNISELPYKAEYETTKSFFYPTSDVPYKNNKLIVEATKNLIKDYKDVNVTLTTDGLDEGINYIGRIPIDEVYKAYASSCLVFPSYIETFGYPLIEAKCSGTIVLASDCEFSHEILDGYENAYFFNPFSDDSLYKLMKAVVTGEIIRKEPQGMCGEFNRENTWDLVIDEILRVANDCVY